jgi:A/G-specific adenine glycosylase
MVHWTEIRKKLRLWYQASGRQLPWRETSDPYRIWVSEIILQQTRVEQGRDFYRRFLERFPDLESLARSEEEEVLKAWQGLGYYSRARNMHEAAKQICRNGDGKFPVTYPGLLALKGIGRYTASAVSSIAFGEPRAVVDGNVHRVLSRLFCIAEAPGTYKASSAVLKAAEELLDRNDPGTHNQAVMELGALICTPRRPGCTGCPLRDHCLAYAQGRIEEFPVRTRAPHRRKRYFNYLVVRSGQCLWMAPRKGKDIWKGLYEFPLIETPAKVSSLSLVRTRAWRELFPGNGHIPGEVTGPFRHILSHQEIHAWFHLLPSRESDSLPGYVKVCPADLDRYPVPKLISNYLDRLSN